MLCHADAADPRRRTRRSDRSPRIRRVGRPSPIADVQLLRRPDDGDSKHPTLSRRDGQNRPVTLTRQRRPRPRGRGERGRQNRYPANSQDLRTTHVDSSRTTERVRGGQSLSVGRWSVARVVVATLPAVPPSRAGHRRGLASPSLPLFGATASPTATISTGPGRNWSHLLPRFRRPHDAVNYECSLGTPWRCVCSTPSGATVLSRGPCGKRGGELRGPSAESAAKALTSSRPDATQRRRPGRRAEPSDPTHSPWPRGSSERRAPFVQKTPGHSSPGLAFSMRWLSPPAPDTPGVGWGRAPHPTIRPG